jgi:hypothetical protein
MELAPSWEGNSCSIDEEMPSTLWKTMVNSRVDMEPLLVPDMWQTIIAYIIRACFDIQFHIILPPTDMPFM